MFGLKNARAKWELLWTSIFLELKLLYNQDIVAKRIGMESVTQKVLIADSDKNLIYLHFHRYLTGNCYGK